jgi:hypothetical protein
MCLMMPGEEHLSRTQYVLLQGVKVRSVSPHMTFEQVGTVLSPPPPPPPTPTHVSRLACGSMINHAVCAAQRDY